MRKKGARGETSDIKLRLKQLTDALGVSGREFSTRIGKSDSYVASINNDITLGVVANIFSAYPIINLQWLVTGKGEILLKEPHSVELASYLLEENKELKKEIKELLVENGKLQAQLEEAKKICAQQESVAACAVAG